MTQPHNHAHKQSQSTPPKQHVLRHKHTQNTRLSAQDMLKSHKEDIGALFACMRRWLCVCGCCVCACVQCACVRVVHACSVLAVWVHAGAVRVAYLPGHRANIRQQVACMHACTHTRAWSSAHAIAQQGHENRHAARQWRHKTAYSSWRLPADSVTRTGCYDC